MRKYYLLFKIRTVQIIDYILKVPEQSIFKIIFFSSIKLLPQWALTPNGSNK